MKIRELLESKSKLIDSIEDVLQEIESSLSDKAQGETSYSIGHPFHQVVSGRVAIRKNFATYHYNMPTQWDVILEVGNNIKGAEALDIVREAYEDLLDEFRDGETTVTQEKDYAVITLGNEKALVKYEYASSFCWIGARLLRG